MAFSTSNIGKNCYINISEDQNVEDSLYGTIIGYYSDSNEEYYFVSINGNVEKIYDDSLINIINSGGGGGGGDVTPAAVATAIGQFTSAQAAQAVSDLGAEPEKLIVIVTESNGVYSADKTFAEIYSAYEAGKSITLFGAIPLTGIEYDEGIGGYAEFSWCAVNSNSGGMVMQYTVEFDGNSDTWSFNESDFDEAQHEIAVLGSAITITPYENDIYKCGELSSLTITNPPVSGSYSIVFTSGSTATTTTIPSTILGLENFAPEANTIYEINVLDNRAVVGSWAVSSS